MVRQATVALSVAALLVATAGCNYQKLTDPEPTTPIPTRFAESKRTEVPEKPRDVRWWRNFGDAQLSALIEEALNENLTVRAGWARVRQAKHLANQARAGLFPQIGAQGIYSQGTSLIPGFGKIEATTLSGSLPVTYELDLFARRTRDFQAGKLEARATALDQQALAITIAAEVAEAWFDVVDTHVQREVLKSQLETEEQFMELVELRYRQGLTSIVDVHQQGQRVSAARSRLSLGIAAAEVAQHSLALLVGDPPDREFALDGVALPAFEKLPDVEPPAGVIAQRPDVIASRRRVEAADRQVAATVGARLPQVTLSFTPEYARLRAEAQGMEGTTKGFVWNAGAQLSVPIFDGLLGKSQIDTERAVLDQALSAYEEAILVALLEVENARVLEHQQHHNIEHLTATFRHAVDGLDATQRRYRQGLTDFLPVFTALATKQTAELALLAAKRTLVGYRVQLYRALGGVWPEQFEEPDR